MIILITLMLSLSALLLLYKFSLLHPVEKLILWSISSIISKHSFTIIELNLGLVEMSNKKIDAVLIYLLGWFFYSPMLTIIAGFLQKGRVQPLYKIALMFISAVFLSFINHLLSITGVIDFKHWNLIFSFVAYIVIILFVFSFAQFFRFIFTHGRSHL